MKRVALAAIAVICCTSPAFAQQPNHDVPKESMALCAVIANASEFDGKEITVRGLYRMVTHGAILMDRACPKKEVNLRQAPSYKADKRASAVLRSLTKKDQFRAVDVVFRGSFRVAQEGQCFGQICAGYEIETTELVLARPETQAGEGVRSQPPTDAPLRHGTTLSSGDGKRSLAKINEISATAD